MSLDKPASKSTSQGLRQDAPSSVLTQDEQGILIHRIGGRFVDLVHGSYFDSGIIQAETNYNPDSALAETEVGPGGMFVFIDLRIPMGVSSLNFRGSRGAEVQNAVSAGYALEQIAKGTYELDSVHVFYNPWNPPEPPDRSILVEGEIRGRVLEKESGDPIANATISMTVTYKCGGPSTPGGEDKYSTTANSRGEYVVTKPALYNKLFVSTGNNGHCSIGSVIDLEAEAPEFMRTKYVPIEASRFEFLLNEYRRDFYLLSA